jgi:hypothetical protein
VATGCVITSTTRESVEVDALKGVADCPESVEGRITDVGSLLVGESEGGEVTDVLVGGGDGVGVGEHKAKSVKVATVCVEKSVSITGIEVVTV